MTEFSFTVYGKNIWDLDHQAGERLASLVGDLVDQQVEYSISVRPNTETYQNEVVLWRGDVTGTIEGSPSIRVYNRTGLSGER